MDDFQAAKAANGGALPPDLSLITLGKSTISRNFFSNKKFY